MHGELEAEGYDVNVVAINVVGGEGSQQSLTSRCSFDLLQDVASVEAWNMLDGRKDDMFVYREGGALAPSGYLANGGPLNTNLSTAEGYSNVYNAIVRAHALGPAESCDDGEPPEPGWQRPGNINQDANLDVSDGVALLGYLFLRSPQVLPCGTGDLTEEGNRALLDSNGDGDVGISDAVYLLSYLFLGTSPPVLGSECVSLPGCPDTCGM